MKTRRLSDREVALKAIDREFTKPSLAQVRGRCAHCLQTQAGVDYVEFGETLPRLGKLVVCSLCVGEFVRCLGQVPHIVAVEAQERVAALEAELEAAAEKIAELEGQVKAAPEVAALIERLTVAEGSAE